MKSYIGVNVPILSVLQISIEKVKCII